MGKKSKKSKDIVDVDDGAVRGRQSNEAALIIPKGAPNARSYDGVLVAHPSPDSIVIESENWEDHVGRREAVRRFYPNWFPLYTDAMYVGRCRQLKMQLTGNTGELMCPMTEEVHDTDFTCVYGGLFEDLAITRFFRPWLIEIQNLIVKSDTKSRMVCSDIEQTIREGLRDRFVDVYFQAKAKFERAELKIAHRTGKGTSATNWCSWAIACADEDDCGGARIIALAAQLMLTGAHHKWVDYMITTMKHVISQIEIRLKAQADAAAVSTSSMRFVDPTTAARAEAERRAAEARRVVEDYEPSMEELETWEATMTGTRYISASRRAQLLRYELREKAEADLVSAAKKAAAESIARQRLERQTALETDTAERDAKFALRQAHAGASAHVPDPLQGDVGIDQSKKSVKKEQGLLKLRTESLEKRRRECVQEALMIERLRNIEIGMAITASDL